MQPLVIASTKQAVADRTAALVAAKRAVAAGADLIELPAGLVDGGLIGALRALGIDCVGRADDNADVETLTQAGAAVVHWIGSGGAPRALETPPILVGGTRDLHPGDSRVVAVDDLATLSELPAQVNGIVDLGGEQDRAKLAALVALGLLHGADGFLTCSPSPVRRAAYVIRAVENAR